MDNVQICDSYISILSSQPYRSYSNNRLIHLYQLNSLGPFINKRSVGFERRAVCPKCYSRNNKEVSILRCNSVISGHNYQFKCRSQLISPLSLYVGRGVRNCYIEHYRSRIWLIPILINFSNNTVSANKPTLLVPLQFSYRVVTVLCVLHPYKLSICHSQWPRCERGL
jgi:hypothetical protein